MVNSSPSPVVYIVYTTVTPSTVEGGAPYDFVLDPEPVIVLDPEPVIVTRRNAIIAYQLTDATPASIVFTGMCSINDDPDPAKHQLSSHLISLDGRTLIISDRNSEKVTINIDLIFGKVKFRDRYGDGEEREVEGEFSHDPQIENVPES